MDFREYGAPWRHQCTEKPDCEAPYHLPQCKFQKRMLVDFKANRNAREHEMAMRAANREKHRG
jgi:hypothetical protein